jgi:hypothetical protein
LKKYQVKVEAFKGFVELLDSKTRAYVATYATRFPGTYSLYSSHESSDVVPFNEASPSIQFCDAEGITPLSAEEFKSFPDVNGWYIKGDTYDWRHRTEGGQFHPEFMIFDPSKHLTLVEAYEVNRV